MSRRIVRWLVPGIIAYLVFLCATFPAAYATRWLRSRTPGIQLSEVSGSIWSGQAQQLVFESVPLGRVSWHFDWRAPWSGQLGYHLRITDEGMQLDGRVAIGHGQRLVIHNLVGRVPLQRLDHWLPLPPDSVAGLLQLDLSNLEINNGLPRAAEGTVTLGDASLSWPQSAALGSYRMQLSSAKAITAAIQDSGGPLVLQAEAQLEPDGRYHVSGKLSARDADSAAAHLLTYLGSPDPSGKYPFDFAGHL